MLLQVSLASVITYQMLTLADFDAVALIIFHENLCIQKEFTNFALTICVTNDTRCHLYDNSKTSLYSETHRLPP